MAQSILRLWRGDPVARLHSPRPHRTRLRRQGYDPKPCSSCTKLAHTRLAARRAVVLRQLQYAGSPTTALQRWRQYRPPTPPGVPVQLRDALSPRPASLRASTGVARTIGHLPGRARSTTPRDRESWPRSMPCSATWRAPPALLSLHRDHGPSTLTRSKRSTSTSAARRWPDCLPRPPPQSDLPNGSPRESSMHVRRAPRRGLERCPHLDACHVIPWTKLCSRPLRPRLSPELRRRLAYFFCGPSSNFIGGAARPHGEPFTATLAAFRPEVTTVLGAVDRALTEP